MYRPKLISRGTSFTAKLLGITCPLICAGLGVWQMQRLEWKLSYIEDVKEQMKMEPLDFTQLNEKQWPIWRYINIKGKFEEESILVGPRYSEDTSVVFYVVTPYVLENGGVIGGLDDKTPEKWFKADNSKYPETLKVIVRPHEKVNLFEKFKVDA
ncbi:hypothetical protein O9G_000688 [Rozella allomycis CSF55]|uniref:SURF1-like protein n=1 Tax=Rozella allomycis (strain CSF55) TaxID=988480 RepID=A0A075AYD6_ROZAC|nr:hypothetical protein O9G_000688 [Rozella allomycis CSF55]|eukprot:EPZ35292.1 hypothetical protein O9G_000688 [Rozella allomycis CSF55]